VAPAGNWDNDSSKLRLGRHLQIYFILFKTCLDIFASESRTYTIAHGLDVEATFRLKGIDLLNMRASSETPAPNLPKITHLSRPNI